MKCVISDIKKKINLEGNTPLKELFKAYENPDSSVETIQLALNDAIAYTLNKRNNTLQEAFKGSVPAEYEVTFPLIEVTDTEVRVIQRQKSPIGETILKNTISVGRSGIKLSDFVKSSIKNLNVFLRRSMTLTEFLAHKASRSFRERFTDADTIVLNRIQNQGKVLDEFVNGEDGKTPLFLFLKNQASFNDAVIAEKDFYTDPIKYLLTIKPNGQYGFDPLVLEAVNLAVYSWLTTQAKATFFNNRADINRILDRPEDAFLSPEHQRRFEDAGLVQAVLIDRIGKEAFKHLGLTHKANNVIDGNTVDKIKVSLGALGVAYLLEHGVLEQIKIPNSDFPSRATTNTKNNRNTIFVRVKANVQGTVSNRAEERKNISDALKDTLKLTDSERPPSFNPVEEVVAFYNKTRQKVPKATKKILKKLQRDPWEIKNNVADVLLSLDEKIQEEILGINPDPENEHITQRKGVNAKNDRIRDVFESFKKFRSSLEKPDQKFYLSYFLSTVGRIFIRNNPINPQGDKNIRHLVGLSNYNATVNTPQLRKQFKLAVAQAFGFKIEAKAEKESLQRFKEIYSLTTDAVAAIKNGDTSPEAQEAIRAAIKLGGEGVHTLDGLVALAAYHPNKSFDTNLGIEIDGITNGVALGIMQILLGKEGSLPAIGVYTDGKANTYSEWRSQLGSLDLYERLVMSWHNHLQFEEGSDRDRQLKGLSAIFSSFIIDDAVQKTARDLAKFPLMTTNYGQAIGNSVNEFVGIAVDTFYDLITKTQEPKEVAQILRGVNTAIGKPLDMEPDVELKDFELSRRDYALFTQAIRNTYGDALSVALEEELGSFTVFQQTINKAFQIMFKVFNAKYQQQVEEKIKQNGGRLPSISELEEILDSLRAYMPLAKGPMSKGLDDAILVIKGGLQRNYGAPFKVQQRYSRKIKNTVGTETSPLSASLTSYAETYAFSDPGVAGAVAMIHNLDAAIQQAMLSTTTALNIHDAAIYSLADADIGAFQVNQAFAGLSKYFSILDNVYESTNNVLRQGKNDLTIHAEMRTIIKTSGIPEFGVEFRRFKDAVAKAKKDFYETYPNIAINQYASTSQGVFPMANKPKNLEDFIDDSINDLFKEEIDKPSDTKGSADRSVDFDNIRTLFTDTISSTSVETIFNYLEKFGWKKDSAEHTAHLLDVLRNVTKIHKEIDLKVAETDLDTFGVQRTFSDESQDIHLFTSSTNRNDGSTQSAQEVYVHELVHAVVDYGINSDTRIRNAIQRLFKQAEKEFKWENFLPEGVTNPTEQQEKAAKETYNYIFNNTKTEVRRVRDPLTGNVIEKRLNPYLHEFVAYGLTNERVIKKLSTITVSPKRQKADNLFDAIVNWFSDLINLIVDRVNGVHNLKADKALRHLVDQLNTVQQKHTISILNPLSVLNNVNNVIVNQIISNILSPLIAYRQKAKPKHVPGRILYALSALLDQHIYTEFGKAVRQVTFNLGLTERSFIVKLVREMQGRKENNAVWHSLLQISKMTVDQARLHETRNVVDHIRSKFHTEVSDEENEALYKVLLKLDIANLLQADIEYTPEMLMELFRSSTKLQERITAIESELGSYGDAKNYYIKQAKGLGKYMALGKDFTTGQMKNAYVIANLLNVPMKSVEGDMIKAEKLIDELATLYGLQNTSIQLRKLAADVYERENAVDGVDNGIAATLAFHHLHKENSLQAVFGGNKVQTEKGYTRETYHPNRDVKIAPLEAEAELQALGYVRSTMPLSKDPDDKISGERYLYTHDNNTLSSFSKSIVSLTSRQAEGTDIESIVDGIDSAEDYKKAKKQLKRMQQSINAKIFKQFEESPYKTSSLLPIIDEAGRTVSYRYVMAEQNKEELLLRDNRFDHALGRMFGGTIDKTNSLKINDRVVELLKQDFVDHYAENTSDFIQFSTTSTDKEIAEIAKLIPKEMEETFRQVWGDKPIYVRKEFLNLIFGFRKLRLKDSESMVGSAVRGVNDSLTWVLQNTFFPDSGSVDIGKFWADVVSFVKELIVVKTGVILLPNFISNNVLLWIKGVPLSEIAKLQTEALTELSKYKKNLDKRNMLQRELDANLKMTEEAREKIKLKVIRLDQDLAQNPVAELVDKGIFQSIVEDIELEEDIYSIRSQLGRKAEAFADKYLWEFLKPTYQHLYMTRNTKPHQLLYKATQVSDFIARYALYKQKMKDMPKNLRTSKAKEAYRNLTLGEVTESFVNYDVPTSKELQWINDMGLLMFTKFYFRIQKIIFGMFTKKADKRAQLKYGTQARLLSFYMVEHAFNTNIEDISDTNILYGGLFNRGNWPWEVGEEAFTVPLLELFGFID